MKLAAITSEPGIFPVLEAIRNREDMPLLTAWAESNSLRSAIQQAHPLVTLVPHWDALLVEQNVDAVIVAGVSSDVVSAARQLTLLGKPLLVVTDIASGPAKLFEYMPIWQDTPHLLCPLFSSGVSHAVAAVRAETTRATRDPLWKIEFTREIGPVAKSEPGLDLIVIDRFLLQDLDWITSLTGLHSRVTMLTSGQDAQRPVEAIVTLQGEGLAEVRWTVRTSASPPGWELRLHDAAGSTTIRAAEHQPPVMVRNGTSQTLLAGDPLLLDLEQQLNAFAAARMSGGPARSWTDVIRFAELGAAARRSLGRRRTIDVHFEEASERSQFKSQMAAAGCGALLWTMFGAIFLLIAAGLFDPRDREYRASRAAGFVLPDSDFAQGSTALTPAGMAHLDRVAMRWSSVSPVLLVESAVPPNPELDQQRRELVDQRLIEQGVREPQSRVQVRSFPGRWFERMMVVGWIVVFCPLGIMLLLQLFIFASRPGDACADPVSAPEG